MLKPKALFKYDTADSGGGDTGEGAQNDDNGQQQDTQNDASNEVPGTWDEYLDQLPQEAVGLYNEHVTGLKNTVKATRDERDTFKGRLDAVIESLDGKNPEEVRNQLTDMQKELTTANQRSVFFEQAANPEIGCRNARLAWITAQTENLFDRNGNPDWDAIKQVAPEIFGTKRRDVGAGQGNRVQNQTSMGPNEWIRKQTGRQ